jgi:hypothetical protein
VLLRALLLTLRYALDTQLTPAISSINGGRDFKAVTAAAYGSELTITWSPKTAGAALMNVTSVSLVAPSAVTHGFNNNQRLVWLPITNASLLGSVGMIKVALPASQAVAPPQMYMLFLNSGKTYSKAWWVQLL